MMYGGSGGFGLTAVSSLSALKQVRGSVDVVIIDTSLSDPSLPRLA
jgi:Mrp family chromosome partitioning ATPase